jgi:hypothetical protein
MNIMMNSTQDLRIIDANLSLILPKIEEEKASKLIL